MNPGRVLAVVPAFDAEKTVGDVVTDLRRQWSDRDAAHVIVVDDGSADRTSETAMRAGAIVVRHPVNRGKGAALRTALARARDLGAVTAVSVDADGQHPAEEAWKLACHPASDGSLVLGVRDLVRDGAPRANRFSNGISNFFLSRFTGLPLADTQCGLRRYPIAKTLALGGRANGYAYEAETVLRAARVGIEIVQVPVKVHYPPEDLRVTHFDSVRDPARIVFTVLRTLAVTDRARTRDAR